LFSIYPGKKTKHKLHGAGRIALPVILVALSLSCGWGPRDVRVPRPEPTRAPQPTFTHTPLPPTATQVPTDTPVLPANPPAPTDAPPPPDTPTPVPLPTHTPVPPTSTSLPPTAMPVPATPTLVPPPPTISTLPTTAPAPVIRFEVSGWWKRNDCSDLSVHGLVFDAQGNPLNGITVEVLGEEDTYAATSGEDGSYNIQLGSLLDQAEGATWHIQLRENNQIVSKKIEWNTSLDCQDADKIQVLHVEWKRKP